MQIVNSTRYNSEDIRDFIEDIYKMGDSPCRPTTTPSYLVVRPFAGSWSSIRTKKKYGGMYFELAIDAPRKFVELSPLEFLATAVSDEGVTLSVKGRTSLFWAVYYSMAWVNCKKLATFAYDNLGAHFSSRYNRGGFHDLGSASQAKVITSLPAIRFDLEASSRRRPKKDIQTAKVFQITANNLFLSKKKTKLEAALKGIEDQLDANKKLLGDSQEGEKV